MNFGVLAIQYYVAVFICDSGVFVNIFIMYICHFFVNFKAFLDYEIILQIVMGYEHVACYRFYL